MENESSSREKQEHEMTLGTGLAWREHAALGLGLLGPSPTLGD